MFSIIGIAAAVLSGILNGSFAAPMKRIVKWEWENTWLLYALSALLLFPTLIVTLTVPNLLDIYSNVPGSAMLRTFLFGAGWGIGSLTFGLGLHLLGLSLGFTIMMGITAVAGSLIPMAVQNPEQLLTSGGMTILAAMMATVVGVTLCGTAGGIRARAQRAGEQEQTNRAAFGVALGVGILSGILSPMLNFAFSFGVPIAESARAHLTGPAADFLAANTVWLVTLLGGFIPFFSYCCYLLCKRGTWGNFRQPGTRGNWLMAVLMGALWISCIMFYGASATLLGQLGTTMGWLILMSVSVLTANLWGLVTGEWKGAPRKAHLLMILGLGVLTGSVVLVGFGKSLLQ